MNDTLSVKDISIATLDAANFPGSARSFPRVMSSDGTSYLRQSTHISSLSPTMLRVSHQPRKNGVGTQRSVFAIDQDLTRLDTNSNPVLKTRVSVKFQADIPSDVTLAEYQAAVNLLIGALLQDAGLLIASIYSAEV